MFHLQALLLFDDYQGAKTYLLKIYRYRKKDPIKEKATRDLADGRNNLLIYFQFKYIKYFQFKEY